MSHFTPKIGQECLYRDIVTDAEYKARVVDTEYRVLVRGLPQLWVLVVVQCSDGLSRSAVVNSQGYSETGDLVVRDAPVEQTETGELQVRSPLNGCVYNYSVDVKFVDGVLVDIVNKSVPRRV